MKGLPGGSGMKIQLGPSDSGEKRIQKKIEVKIEDINGKKVQKYFVDGKEVKELPGGIKLNIDEIKAEALKNLKPEDLKNGTMHRTIKSQNAIIVLGMKNGKPIILQSGQTPSEYLTDLLADESKWNIQRATSFRGEKLDLFTLKNEKAPVQLYVDPSTARPRYLIFNGMGFMSPIEDVYEFGVTPA